MCPFTQSLFCNIEKIKQCCFFGLFLRKTCISSPKTSKQMCQAYLSEAQTHQHLSSAQTITLASSHPTYSVLHIGSHLQMTETLCTKLSLFSPHNQQLYILPFVLPMVKPLSSTSHVNRLVTGPFPLQPTVYGTAYPSPSVIRSVFCPSKRLSRSIFSPNHSWLPLFLLCSSLFPFFDIAPCILWQLMLHVDNSSYYFCCVKRAQAPYMYNVDRAIPWTSLRILGPIATCTKTLMFEMDIFKPL